MKYFFFCISLVLATAATAQQPFAGADQAWADTLLAHMTLDEKIGQVLMPRANSRNAPYDEARLLDWAQRYHLGGYVFFANQPYRQTQLINKLQAVSKIPMLMGEDLEWGLTMRLDSTVRYPYAMTLGAIRGRDELLRQMGREIAEQCRRIGILVNYAPVADVNNNAKNPVIGFRSFGENRDNVLQKATAYMQGMQDGRLITTAKHFPGHGDTDVDSHADTPVISHPRTRLDSLELYPFRQLIGRGLNGVMVAHLSVPALDPVAARPTTLSPVVVNELLRKQLGFQGLVFTDAMDMQGVARHFPPGVVGVKALLAGNDVLETFVDAPVMFTAIKNAVLAGEIPVALLDEKVRRILQAKAWVGLSHYQPLRLDSLQASLNQPRYLYTARQLAEAALTLVRNENQLLPLKTLEKQRFAVLSVGTPPSGPARPTVFQQTAGRYAATQNVNLTPRTPAAERQRAFAELRRFDRVLVGLHSPILRAANTWPDSLLALAREATTALPNAVFVLFGNPYLLGQLPALATAPAVLVTHQEGEVFQEIAAQQVFGGLGASGQLPVTASAAFRSGQGLTTPPLGCLSYTLPEAVGFDSRRLTARLDSVVQLGLDSLAYPGAAVLVAKEGKVIFRKNYGYHTYDRTRPVQDGDLYDLASVTKVSTSVLALMRLQDEGRFRPEMTLGELFPAWKNLNKGQLKMIDILTHQAGLKAWIPFWRDTVDSTRGGWKRRTFRSRPSRRYPVQVAEHLFLHRRYIRTIFKQIEDSPVNPNPKYVYSDLSYYLYPQVVQKITGKPFEQYLKETFYEPMGATTLTFNAGRHYPLERIVPTEYDSLFRKELIQGRVHDEGATMLGGVSGHAGLFGSANDLAKLMQMYLNGGTYGGRRYIQESTIRQWTAYPFDASVNARRGIGWDKPDRHQPGLSGPASASPLSFGHSGFTGTFVWMEPQENMLYIFLSNRVYPTRSNSKISRFNLRTSFGEMIYRTIQENRVLPRQD